MAHYVLHSFRPGETIEAVLRLKGRHNYSRQEIGVLVAEFNKLNGSVLPKPGMTLKIPLLDAVESEGGEID